MTSKKYLAMGLGVMVMAGCSQMPASNNGPQNGNTNASLEITDKPIDKPLDKPTETAKLDLEGKEWIISSMAKDGKTTDLSDKKFTFSVKKGMAGAKICNSGGTAVRVEGDKLISDGPVISTLMFCEGTMDYEQAFFNGLDNDFKIEMKGDQLVLSDAGTVFTLSPAATVSDAGDTDWEALLSDQNWTFTDMAKGNVATNWSEKGYTFGIQGQSMVAKICNSSTAAYELDGNKLSATGPVASTKMFCEGKMEDESAFQASMNNGLTLSKDGDQLVMKDSVSETEYRLKAEVK